MGINDSHIILAPDEAPAAEVINPAGKGLFVLVCEHASAFIPASLRDLGLAPQDRHSHAVWDIGGLDLAKRLSVLLDAPLVASRVSRLVYDCNRPPESPTAIPAQSEIISVPRNRDLPPEERAARVAEVYRPFEALVAKTVADKTARDPVAPVLVTVHSFTPVFYGKPRLTELGILHDDDDRFAQAMMAAAAARGQGIKTELNAPYAASDGVTHTLRRHGNGLLNVMLEIRNDMIDHASGVETVADDLNVLLNRAFVALEPTLNGEGE